MLNKIEKIKKSIRVIKNFPKPGINFKDITTLLQSQDAFNNSIELFVEEFKNKKIDVIVGIESRGFIFASPLALKLNARFALARKPGKLPSKLIREDYDLEYGTDSIEIHEDAIKNSEKVLIIDDLLATGGTAKATGNLVGRLGGDIIGYGFLIKLNSLNGENKLNHKNVFSIINY